MTDYVYGITTTTVWGETKPTLFEVAVDPGNSLRLDWDPLGPPVTGFRVYRGLSADTLGLIGFAPSSTFTDNFTVTPGAPAPGFDSSASVQGSDALKLARAITPAHLAILTGYSQGFLVGISQVDMDVL